MIDGIVVDEGGQMHKFENGRQRERIRVRAPTNLAHEEEEGRAEKLTSHTEEVIVHLLLKIEVGQDDSPNFVHHPVEPILHRLLDAREPRIHRSGWALKARHESPEGRGRAVRWVTAAL